MLVWDGGVRTGRSTPPLRGDRLHLAGQDVRALAEERHDRGRLSDGDMVLWDPDKQGRRLTAKAFH
jgi:hypothetical protein